jgi:Tol biopolymer transport system component
MSSPPTASEVNWIATAIRAVIAQSAQQSLLRSRRIGVSWKTLKPSTRGGERRFGMRHRVNGGDMKLFLILVLALTLLFARASMALGNYDATKNLNVDSETGIFQTSAMLPMRLIFGVGTQYGAQPYLTEIGINGLAPPAEMSFSFVNGEFSFDGQFIGFDNCGDRHGQPRGIYVAELDDQTSRKLLPLTSEICVAVRWAPDGQRVSFDNPEDHRLHIISLATGEVNVMPNRDVGWHWWSPKGDQIVFERGKGGRRELFITDLDGNERQLTFRKDFNNCETWAPTWSRDGSRIAFTVSEPNKKLSLYTISPDGDEVRKLETPGNAYSPRWSTDGEWIIYLDVKRLMRIRNDGRDIGLIGELITASHSAMSSFSLGPRN